MIAFWKYDLFPYCLHARIKREEPNGYVSVEGFGGMMVKPLACLPDEQGEKVSAELESLREEYRVKQSELLAEYMAKAKQAARFL